MGFSDKAFGTLRRLFKQDKEKSGEDLARGTSVPPNMPAGLLSSFSEDNVVDYLRIDQDILTRYADYCLTGETRVATPYKQGWLTIKEIVDRYNSGEKTIVFSRNKDGAIVAAQISNAWETGIRQIWDITLDDGTRISATENHPFMLRDGSYRRVDELTPGTALMPFQRKNAGGYRRINYKSRHAPEHVLVAELSEGRRVHPGKECVHHKNFIKNDNSPQNLKIMSIEEHASYHAEINNRRFSDPKNREKQSEIAKKRWSASGDLRKAVEAGTFATELSRATGRKNIKIALEANKLKQPGLKMRGRTDQKGLQNANADRSFTFQDICDKYQPGMNIASLSCAVNKDRNKVVRRIKMAGYKDFWHFRDTYTNHKVVSVVKTERFEPVYDLTVPEHHNFALCSEEFGSGIIVSNSAMDEYAEITSALDVFADDSSQVDSQRNKRIWIQSKDENLKVVLEDLFHKTLRLDEELWEIARTLCKNGNDFEEILVTGEGVKGLNYLPTPTMRRIETPYGSLKGFIQSFTGNVGYTPEQFDEFLKKRLSEPNVGHEYQDTTAAMRPQDFGPLALEAWEVAHFRLRIKSRRSLYGQSILDSARHVFKRLTMLEDSALLYSLQRAPERFAFYVDVGDLPPKESMALLNQMKNSHKKKRFIDPATGKLSLKWEPLTPNEDFYIGVRNGKEGTRIENLQAPSWQNVDTLNYFRDKMFSALKVPKTYLGQEEGAARASLSSQDVRFARAVLRVQQELKNGFRKIARVHLAALGIDPDETDYDICMTSPSAIFELAQIEVRNAQADLAGKLGAFVSQYYLLSRVLGLSDEEIEDVIKQRADDMKRDAVNQAHATEAGQVAVPPAPPVGADGAVIDPNGQNQDGTQQPTQQPPPQVPAQESRTYGLAKSSVFGNYLPVGVNNGITEKELFKGYKSNRDGNIEQKIERLLRTDRVLVARLDELQRLLKEVSHTVRSNSIIGRK